jgi:hypothetical protein
MGVMVLLDLGLSAALLGACTLFACTKEAPPAVTEEPRDAAVARAVDPAEAASPTSGARAAPCDGTMYQGFADPHAAYAAYAEASREGDFCQAINTYAPAERAELVLMQFKGLAMLAGADNPRRLDYQEQFRQFCLQHQLGCGSPESATAIAQAVMLRLSLDAELGPLRALAGKRPEDVYVALMTRMAAVDASAIRRFSTPLAELHIEGARAVAKAPQTDGSLSTLPFVKTPPGWMLAVR